MLPRAHRLRRSADFSDVVRRGRRAGTSTVVVYTHAAAPASALPLVGFVVGRNVGPAVVRNRVKRRLRHLMAERIGDLAPGRIVVRANPPAADATFSDLSRDVDSGLTRLARRREAVSTG